MIYEVFLFLKFQILKRPECSILYPPSKVSKDYPDANLMTYEELFSWLGRFKKILNRSACLFVFLFSKFLVRMECMRRRTKWPLNQENSNEKQILGTPPWPPGGNILGAKAPLGIASVCLYVCQQFRKVLQYTLWVAI